MTARIYLDTRATDGEAPLKIAIAHNLKTAYIPTGKRILKSQWDKDRQAVINHENRKELNSFLRSMLAFVEREMMKLESLGLARGKSAVEVKDMILCELNPDIRAKKESEKSFLFRLKRFASIKKGQTKDSYEWTIKKLMEFDANLAARSFDDISHDYLQDFVNHYKDLSVNSRGILLRNIRAVFNDAIDADITTSYPFRRFSIKSENTCNDNVLTARELRILMETDSKQENEYRDMFLLMIYLRGINSVDLFSARWSQVVNGRLEYRRSKVGTLFSVKIEPEAMEIINRYKGKEYLLNPLERYNNYRCYQHHMNDGLKRIGAKRGKCNKIVGDGMFPKLTSNWARHTWATIAAEIDIPDPTITLGMGHSVAGHRVTAIYINRDMKKVDDANRKIIDYICKQ